MIIIIIVVWCRDKLFPVLGFGAKLPGGSVSHEFAVVSPCVLLTDQPEKQTSWQATEQLPLTNINELTWKSVWFEKKKKKCQFGLMCIICPLWEDKRDRGRPCRHYKHQLKWQLAMANIDHKGSGNSWQQTETTG